MQNKSRPPGQYLNVQQYICKKNSYSYTPVLLDPYLSADCILCDGQGGVKVSDHGANKTLKS